MTHAFRALGLFVSRSAAKSQPSLLLRLLRSCLPGLTRVSFKREKTSFNLCYVDAKGCRKVAWLKTLRTSSSRVRDKVGLLDPPGGGGGDSGFSWSYKLRIQKVDVSTRGRIPAPSRTKQQPKTSQVYLIVQVPPIIYKVSDDIIVNEGSNVTLTCLANGRPDPSITWRLLNPSAEALDVGEYLEISGIIRSQAGRYECKASNDVSTPDVKYVSVVVNYPPYIKDVRSSETPVGQAGVLHCEASAVPQPEFEWYRDERRLSSSQSVSIQIKRLSRTLLVVANVTEDDYGNYTCVATNRLGIHNASVFLYKPSTGRDINASGCACQSFWLLLLSVLSALLKC
ncbi:limbic system-associated membrane protein-like [Cyprinus carpio]|uniref:Limbic system-associated membrane protein-like n=1 Tax=Cyprinus carpio TaxID=7962 RepID=A0A9R0BA63_CYPCA|nr:limbic system-associated membrane protein-like [Cyprinus carpio]